MLQSLANNSLETQLDECAEGLLTEAAWKEPAVDVVQLAARRGVAVVRDTKLAGRARYVRIASGRGRARDVIYVGRADRPERLQWAVAHELGEMHAYRVLGELDDHDLQQSPGLRERVANGLACRLLLPRTRVQSLGEECDWDLLAMKRVFRSASHELIARRMVDLMNAVIVTVYDHGKSSWRRGSSPSCPPLSSEELAAQQQAHQSGSTVRTTADAFSIRAWPVHEPNWRREILQTRPLSVGGLFD